MELYQDQFSESHHFPKVNKPQKILIIASTARCGSHMLGHALHETGQFGYPLEYANGANLAEWQKRLGTSDLESTIHALQECRTSPNGVFAIKIHYGHIQQFGGFDVLKALFPDAYYVLLSRGNVLNQAVSLSIAKQTGVWISGQSAQTEKPVFKFEDINLSLKQTLKNNASWRYALAVHDCKVIELNFDDVKQNLDDSIIQIATFMQLDFDESKLPKGLVTKQQKSPLNSEWKQRFLNEHDGRELFYKQHIYLLKSIRKTIKVWLKKLKI